MIKQILAFSAVTLIILGGGYYFLDQYGYVVWSSHDQYVYQPATVVSFQASITAKDLKNKYRRGHLRLLIVPGHDNEYSGGIYRGKHEADLNIELARYLAELLAGNTNLEVLVSRDLVTGYYTRDVVKVFNDTAGVLNFKSMKKSLMIDLLANGLVADRKNDNHNFANKEIAYRLYAINKWANESKVDLIVHIHFNDYPGHKYDKPGKYQGLAIYIPDDQYPNGSASLGVGQAVFSQLNTIRPTSTNPLELGGLISSQELIAVGSNASVNAAAILIEYGYIYEPAFQSDVEREKIFKAMAQQTYDGLVNYLK